MIYDIGPHRVQHGDIMDGIDELMGTEKADFIYTDPPWGQGLLTYFQTLNKRQTGAETKQIAYDEFMPRLFEILWNYSRDVVVVAYGEKWREDVINQAIKQGFKHCGTATSYYKSGSVLRPSDHHFLSKEADIELTPKFIEEHSVYKSDLHSVRQIFKLLGVSKKSICLDPMCGMGYTAQATLDIGAYFRGLELNSKRLEKTINKLESQ